MSSQNEELSERQEYLAERYLERVAIMIHEGGLSEKQAKRQAFLDLFKEVGKEGLPFEMEEET